MRVYVWVCQVQSRLDKLVNNFQRNHDSFVSKRCLDPAYTQTRRQLSQYCVHTISQIHIALVHAGMGVSVPGPETP